MNKEKIKFDLCKKNALEKLQKCDKSPKGSLDEPIADLVHMINAENDYVTTSSCSGRIALFKGGKWLLSNHSHVSFEEMKKCLNEINKLKAGEILLLKIQCRSIETASNLLQIGIESGFRESGIIPLNKIMLAIRTTSNSLEIPLYTKEKEETVNENISEMFSEKYIKYLVNYCNDLYDKNSKRIEILSKNINQYFTNMKNPIIKNYNKSNKNKLKIEQIKNIIFDDNDKESENKIRIIENKDIIFNNSNSKSIMRYGHSIVKLNNSNILIFGGYGKNEINENERRLNDILIYNKEKNEINIVKVNNSESELPIPRLFHQSLLYNNKYFISFGGRTNPNECLNDIIIYDIELNKWFIYKENNNNNNSNKYPSPRWNYSFVLTESNRIILYGGRNEEKVFNDIWKLNITIKESEKDKFVIEWNCLSDENRKNIIPRFLHCGIDIGNDNILFIGGLCDLIYPMKTTPPIMIFDIKNNVIKMGNISNNNCFSIYGSKILKIDRNNYLIVGGMNYYCYCNDNNNSKSEMSDIKLLNIHYDNELVMNIRHLCNINEYNPYSQSVLINNKLIIIGGGGSLVWTSHYSKSLSYLLNIESNSEIESYKEKREEECKVESEIETAEEEIEIPVIEVPNNLVKKFKNELTELKLFNNDYKIMKGENNMCYIPLKISSKDEIIEIKNDDDKYKELSEYFKTHSIQYTNKLKSSHISVYSLLIGNIKNWYNNECNDEMKSKITFEELISNFPSKIEKVGDIIVIPNNYLTLEIWKECKELYKWISELYNTERIAVYSSIDSGIKRESHTKIIYPLKEGIDGNTCVRQNGIYYYFDITKTMFSSGNVTERVRMGKLKCDNEIVFDLYSGIGYFTLPILKYGNPSHLYACDINPNSIKSLRYNMEKNNIDESKYTILLGDNKDTTAEYKDIADRILLGLLPSSENGWNIAIRLLKREGGMLHIHENIKDTEYEKWKEYLVKKLGEISKIYEKPYKFEVIHLETVKSYAPHIYHVVADVFCKGN